MQGPNYTNDHGQTIQVPISIAQAQVIQNHLAMVFKHDIDPSYGDKKHQADLSKAHQGLVKMSDVGVNINC